MIHQSHIRQYTNQSSNVHNCVLNSVLCDAGQVHCTCGTLISPGLQQKNRQVLSRDVPLQSVIWAPWGFISHATRLLIQQLVRTTSEGNKKALHCQPFVWEIHMLNPTQSITRSWTTWIVIPTPYTRVWAQARAPSVRIKLKINAALAKIR